MDKEKVIKGLEQFKADFKPFCGNGSDWARVDDAINLLKEQDYRIKKYEDAFDLLGIGFREWATKIVEGEAEAICEVDEHKMETVIRFRHI